MNIRDYLQDHTPTEKREFAEACGTNWAYMAQLSCGARVPSPTLARKISEQSEGQIALHDLRPDVWPKEAA